MQLKWPMLWDLFSLFPAHAGVIRSWEEKMSSTSSFPRTRGGDPFAGRVCADDLCFSPHTRG